MKRFGFVTGALLAMLVVAPADAQQPGTANDPHHSATQGTAPPTPAPPSTPGAKGGDMPMMDMCRQTMTGDMMAMPMMGGPVPADPKEKADMLQMRGEMMMKHARRMQGGPAK